MTPGLPSRRSVQPRSPSRLAFKSSIRQPQRDKEHQEESETGNSNGRQVRGLTRTVGLVSFVSSWFTTAGWRVPDNEDSTIAVAQDCCGRKVAAAAFAAPVLRRWCSAGLRPQLNDAAASPLRSHLPPVGLRAEVRARLRPGRIFASCADLACDRFHVVDIRLGGASRRHCCGVTLRRRLRRSGTAPAGMQSRACSPRGRVPGPARPFPRRRRSRLRRPARRPECRGSRRSCAP